MPSEPAPHDPYGPYVSRTRDEWAKLSNTLPVHVTEEMVRAARSSQDTIDVEQVRQVYAPLTELISLYVRHTGDLYATTHDFLDLRERRTPFVIGVAGSVSVGKSTTSRLLKELLAQTPGHPHVDLVTTDGFLYPNSILAERGLMARKGFPESYDRAALLRFVMEVKSGASEVTAPVYSHLIYDIVPDDKVVIRRPQILIVEGLNVLQPPRRRMDGFMSLSVSDFFDFSVYVDAAQRNLRQWYIERFMGLRKTAFSDPNSYFRRYAELDDDEAVATAGNVWDTINGPNLMANILPTRGRATVILRKDARHDIEWIRIRKV
jgi:type I pantothenate kinase